MGGRGSASVPGARERGTTGPGAGRARRAARGTAERDSRRPRGARGPRGPGADHPRHSTASAADFGGTGPRSGRRGLVRAARDRSRPRPLPGRGGNGGVPGSRVQRSPRSARRRPGSPGRPRTSRPRGWTPSAWTPSTWRRTAARQRSSRPGRCWRTHAPTPASTRRPPSATSIAQDHSKNSGYQQLANVVILVSLPIAGCTLAAGIAAGLADRKRPFSLLRLTGARLATLRRVVALEGAVPLLAVAAVAIGTGFGAAAMFASEAQQHPMVAPGAAYYLLTAAGSWCPSASSRPPSRCWHASPARGREKRMTTSTGNGRSARNGSLPRTCAACS
jgi:hypothetical protein